MLQCERVIRRNYHLSPLHQPAKGGKELINQVAPPLPCQLSPLQCCWCAPKHLQSVVCLLVLLHTWSFWLHLSPSSSWLFPLCQSPELLRLFLALSVLFRSWFPPAFDPSSHISRFFSHLFRLVLEGLKSSLFCLCFSERKVSKFAYTLNVRFLMGALQVSIPFYIIISVIICRATV